VTKEKRQFINPLKTPLPRKGSDRRLLILSAAEEIFSAKGYTEASIADIAQAVGIQESILYRHFKGKEDVLFSIIEERLKEGLALLDRDLQGLNEPKSQLRKMMWGNLWYQEAYSAYSKLLFFECRRLNTFYASPAFTLIQKYLGRLTAILEWGVRSGVFRKDLPIPLMQEMVMGLLDTINIGFQVVGEVGHPLDDFEDAANLIELVIAEKAPSEDEKGDKSRAILRAAEKVFAKKEFQKAKMTDIARLAGVGDGTLYEYFENKERLLYAIPEGRFEAYYRELSGIFDPRAAHEKLKRTVKYFFAVFLSDRDFFRLFVRNLYLNQGFYRSEGYQNFKKLFSLLEETVKEGKAGGVVRSEVHPRIFRNLLIGTLCWMATRWFAERKTTETGMMKQADFVADLMVEAVTV
jgi:TetR/AcrR family fatty acid metabolism transcriptional regulator